MTVPRDLFADIAEIDAWFQAHNPRTPEENALRVMKCGEEFGEAVQAYIGMTGQNPRKGITHTLDDLLFELADVALCALCAIQHFTQDIEGTRNVMLRKSALGTQRAAAFPATGSPPAR